MKIILVQTEIEDAIKAYVGNNVSLGDQELEVDLTAGRGGNGFTAEIAVTTGNQAKVKLVAAPVPAPEEDALEAGEIDPKTPLFGGSETA